MSTDNHSIELLGVLYNYMFTDNQSIELLGVLYNYMFTDNHSIELLGVLYNSVFTDNQSIELLGVLYNYMFTDNHSIELLSVEPLMDTAFVEFSQLPVTKFLKDYFYHIVCLAADGHVVQEVNVTHDDNVTIATVQIDELDPGTNYSLQIYLFRNEGLHVHRVGESNTVSFLTGETQ